MIETQPLIGYAIAQVFGGKVKVQAGPRGKTPPIVRRPGS